MKKAKEGWDKKNRDYDEDGLPEIKVSYAAVLSRPLFYPENNFSHGLAVLMRRKTFTKTEIEVMREMGFKVDISVRKVELPDFS